LDAKGFDARIAALEIVAIRSELDLHRNEMELLSNRFVEAVRNFATVSLDRFVGNRVLANPDIAGSEGQARLSRVKAGLEGLKEHAQKLIEFLRDERCRHRKQTTSGPKDEPLESGARGANAEVMPIATVEGLESLLWNVIELLEKLGLFDDRGPSPDFQRVFGGPIQYEHLSEFVNSSDDDGAFADVGDKVTPWLTVVIAVESLAGRVENAGGSDG
jgi:hypothetical protein